MVNDLHPIDVIIEQLETDCASLDELRACVLSLAMHLKNLENSLRGVETAWEMFTRLRKQDERQQRLFEDAA